MKVLIAGATGMIGTNLVVALQKSGHSPIVLTRSMLKARLLFNEDVKYAEWDSDTKHSLKNVIEEVDAVINLAGENLNAKTWTKTQKKVIIDSRVEAAQTLAKAIATATKKPKTFLQASATGWYGKECNAPADETAPKGTGFLADVVEQWENADDEVEKLGIRYVLMRTGVVLEPNEGALSAMALPFKLGVGGHFGKGDQFISWIHIKDEIRAILFLLENEDLSGTFNLTSPNPVTMRNFATALGKSHNRPSWFHVPAPFLKLLMGERAKEMILSSTNVIPKRLVESGFEFSYPDIQEAFNDLFKQL
jgi:uncharacterized protein (TIGR01777 family)